VVNSRRAAIRCERKRHKVGGATRFQSITSTLMGRSLATFRTAAVKSFEYVYELSVRLIRRALEAKAVSPAEIDEMDFKTLIRTAAEKGLIDDPLPWYLFREKRSITAHTYDQTKAIGVLAVVPQLVERVRFLLERLREQNAPG
jgi:nucleotidyltransferase substrate binding protein (TIGR01987 family)